MMKSLVSGLCWLAQEPYDASFLEGEIVFKHRFVSRETHTVEAYSTENGTSTSIEPCFTLNVEFRGILSPAKRTEIDLHMNSTWFLTHLRPRFVVQPFYAADSSRLGTQLYRIIQGHFGRYHPAPSPRIVFDWSDAHHEDCNPLWCLSIWIHLATCGLLAICANEVLVYPPRFHIRDFTEAGFQINGRRYQIDIATATIPDAITQSTRWPFAYQPTIVHGQGPFVQAAHIPSMSDIVGGAIRRIDVDPNCAPWASQPTQECVVCCAARPNTLPCRHLCLCGNCFAQMVEQTNKCPLCRCVPEAFAYCVPPTSTLGHGGVSSSSSSSSSFSSSVRVHPTTIPAVSTAWDAPPPSAAFPVTEELSNMQDSTSTITTRPVRRRDRLDVDVLAAISMETPECVVCCAAESTTILFPCRHLCLCESCVSKLVEISDKCPLCRCGIDEYAFAPSSVQSLITQTRTRTAYVQR